MAARVMTIGETQGQAADAAAFEALFRAEYVRVRTIAARTGLDAAASEDVAQEVFVQFHRRHRAGASYAAAWLCRAAAHLALNAIRTRKRRDAREAREALASMPIEAGAVDAWEPQRAIVDEERRREVRDALGRLSPRHATVLVLRHSGMSYAEVASAIGIPIAHVGTLLRRAESAFKKEFDHAAPR